MTPPLPYLRLPLRIDLDGLRSDLAVCLQETWPEHFNKRDYAGSWKVIALRSPNGLAAGAYAHGNDFMDTPLMALCPAVRALIGQMETSYEAVRLLCLAPGSQIHTHVDQGMAYFDGTFRLHIPLETSAEARFVIDGHSLHMPEGSCWYGNFSLPHSVENLGPVPRIHLVVDAHRNAWTDTFFSAAGMDLAIEAADADQRNPVDWIRVAGELEAMGTETALAMAHEIRQKSRPD